eukprot:scaffold8166_cov376-Prasinococcus_capsulatus_cf.AAC.4
MFQCTKVGTANCIRLTHPRVLLVAAGPVAPLEMPLLAYVSRLHDIPHAPPTTSLSGSPAAGLPSHRVVMTVGVLLQ